jgi:hypothetical protein
MRYMVRNKLFGNEATKNHLPRAARGITSVLALTLFAGGGTLGGNDSAQAAGNDQYYTMDYNPNAVPCDIFNIDTAADNYRPGVRTKESKMAKQVLQKCAKMLSSLSLTIVDYGTMSDKATQKLAKGIRKQLETETGGIINVESIKLVEADKAAYKKLAEANPKFCINPNDPKRYGSTIAQESMKGIREKSDSVIVGFSNMPFCGNKASGINGGFVNEITSVYPDKVSTAVHEIYHSLGLGHTGAVQYKDSYVIEQNVNLNRVLKQEIKRFDEYGEEEKGRQQGSNPVLRYILETSNRSLGLPTTIEVIKIDEEEESITLSEGDEGRLVQVDLFNSASILDPHGSSFDGNAAFFEPVIRPGGVGARVRLSGSSVYLGDYNTLSYMDTAWIGSYGLSQDQAKSERLPVQELKIGGRRVRLEFDDVNLTIKITIVE